MKLTQTQFPFSSLSRNDSNNGLIILAIFLIAGTVLTLYLKNLENRKIQTP